MPQDGAMRGYHDASYGDAFAEVYDDWYQGISDVATTTRALFELAAGGRVLELGVGTGRLAIPLAATGVEVHGLDTSELMLQRLETKSNGEASGSNVHVHLGDMVDDLPAGPFSLVFAAYNTFFNLLSHDRQQACFRQVSNRLSEGGHLVIEAFVPDTEHEPASSITVRSVTADRVVLSVSTSDPTGQRAEGQYVDITEAGGVRLRPWSIRWATPAQLDDMASAAGFTLVDRWESFDGARFSPDSPRHVSIFCKGTRANSGSDPPFAS
jgi:SAM-dependent methyltransferase